MSAATPAAAAEPSLIAEPTKHQSRWSINDDELIALCRQGMDTHAENGAEYIVCDALLQRLEATPAAAAEPITTESGKPAAAEALAITVESGRAAAARCDHCKMLLDLCICTPSATPAAATEVSELARWEKLANAPWSAPGITVDAVQRALREAIIALRTAGSAEPGVEVAPSKDVLDAVEGLPITNVMKNNLLKCIYPELA